MAPEPEQQVDVIRDPALAHWGAAQTPDSSTQVFVKPGSPGQRDGRLAVLVLNTI